MRIRFAMLVTLVVSILIVFNLTGACASHRDPQENSAVYVEVVEWPLIENGLSGPDLLDLDDCAFDEAVDRIIAEAEKGWMQAGLDQEHIRSLKRDARGLLSALVRGDFEAYNTYLVEHGAELRDVSGFVRSFEEQFGPPLPVEEWEEMDDAERFTLIWATPSARKAEWRQVDDVTGGLGLREERSGDYWRVFQRSLWRLPDRDKLGREILTDTDIPIAWIKARVSFTERNGPIRMVYVYDKDQDAWLPLLIDIIGEGEGLMILY